jgi:hypothetical protein
LVYDVEDRAEAVKASLSSEVVFRLADAAGALLPFVW